MYLPSPTIETIGEELRKLWGDSGLARCPAPALHDVSIPESGKRLLAEFGLPRFWGRAYLRDVAHGLPRLEKGYSHYRIVGTATHPSLGPSHICLDELRGGAVVYVRLRPKAEEELVNTSVERFAAYLCLHRRLLSETAVLARDIEPVSATEAAPQHKLDAYGEAVNVVLDRIEQDMRRVDPAVWEGLSGTRGNYTCNATGASRGYWPDLLVEFGEFTMWDGEEVLEQWMTDDNAVG